jgi:hypothetical protein
MHRFLEVQRFFSCNEQTNRNMGLRKTASILKGKPEFFNRRLIAKSLLTILRVKTQFFGEIHLFN